MGRVEWDFDGLISGRIDLFHVMLDWDCMLDEEMSSTSITYEEGHRRMEEDPRDRHS